MLASALIEPDMRTEIAEASRFRLWFGVAYAAVMASLVGHGPVTTFWSSGIQSRKSRPTCWPRTLLRPLLGIWLLTRPGRTTTLDRRRDGPRRVLAIALRALTRPTPAPPAPVAEA
jgi:hypothetical protein